MTHGCAFVYSAAAILALASLKFVCQQAQENTPLFRMRSRNLNQKWNSIYSKKLLQRKDYEESQTEDLGMKIEKVWKEFVESDLPRVLK